MAPGSKPDATDALLAAMGQVGGGGILGNARASSRPVMTENAVAARTETLTCPGCGAPRVQGDQGYVCAYCGREIR